MDRVMVRNRVRARARDRLGLYLDRVMVRNRVRVRAMDRLGLWIELWLGIELGQGLWIG